MDDLDLTDVTPISTVDDIDLGMGEPLELDGRHPDDTPNPRQGGDLVAANTNHRHGDGLVVNVVWDVENSELVGLAKTLDISITETPSELVALATKNLNMSATYRIMAGLQLLVAKETCGHGAFGEICENMGISQPRASEVMSYARFASQVPPEDLHKFLELPKKSAVALASADPEVIQVLLDDNHLEKTRRIRNKTQLKEIIKELNDTEDALEKTAKENVALHEEIAGLKADAARKEAGSEYPPEVVLLRKESSALADEALADLASIQTYEERFQQLVYLSDLEESERFKQAAIYPALSNIASVARSALILLRDMAERNGIAVDDIATFTTAFDPEELDVIEAARLKMLDRKKERALTRQDVYATQGLIKRKPGRQQSPA